MANITLKTRRVNISTGFADGMVDMGMGCCTRVDRAHEDTCYCKACHTEDTHSRTHHVLMSVVTEDTHSHTDGRPCKHGYKGVF